MLEKLLNSIRKNKSFNKNTWDEYIAIIKLTLVAALSIFACIYFFDLFDLPSKWNIVNNDNSKEWLNFCINYFGTIVASFIGFIGAIMAVFITIEKQNEFRKEDSRKNVLPLIKVMADASLEKFSLINPPIVDLAGDDETLILIVLSFENVGQREMYDIWVGGVKYFSKRSKKYYNIAPILYKNDKYKNCIASAIRCKDEIETIEVSFRIYFRDCYDNWYYQEIYGKNARKASHKIDYLEIKSAPMLVDKTGLPKAIKRKTN